MALVLSNRSRTHLNFDGVLTRTLMISVNGAIEINAFLPSVNASVNTESRSEHTLTHCQPGVPFYDRCSLMTSLFIDMYFILYRIKKLDGHLHFMAKICTQVDRNREALLYMNGVNFISSIVFVCLSIRGEGGGLFPPPFVNSNTSVGHVLYILPRACYKSLYVLFFQARSLGRILLYGE